MATIQAYLLFNGNCRQAMTFYKKCLGGRLTVQTVDRIKWGVVTEMRSPVVHACLINRFFVLQGTDLLGEQPLHRGNGVSLILQCESRAEMIRYFSRLSHHGKKNQEPMVTDHGSLLASITDQFGLEWLLCCQQTPGMYGRGI